MIEYRDPITGYTVRKYTEGPERNAKLYFTCENFSVDDRYFFFHKDSVPGDLNGGCCRAEVETGVITRVTDDTFRGFATDRQKNIGHTWALSSLCAVTPGGFRRSRRWRCGRWVEYSDNYGKQ